MKTLTITTREGVITRESASFQIEIDRDRGDLIATGYDKQREKTCFVIVARGEWADVTIDTPEKSDAETEAEKGKRPEERSILRDSLSRQVARVIASNERVATAETILRMHQQGHSAEQIVDRLMQQGCEGVRPQEDGPANE